MSKLEVNQIVLSKDTYGSRDRLFAAVAAQLSILLENEYVCKIYDDDKDIIVIEFDHDNDKGYWGGPDLVWEDGSEENCCEDSDGLFNSSLDYKEEPDEN